MFLTSGGIVCAESGHSGKGGGEDDADSDDGALDNKELAAETQRILRGELISPPNLQELLCHHCYCLPKCRSSYKTGVGELKTTANSQIGEK